MQSIEVNQVLNTWPQLGGIIYMPHTEEEYERLVTFHDRLVDEIGEDESHLLAPLLEIVGVLIESYEDQHVPELTE